MMNRGTLANFLTCSDLGVPARKTGDFDKVEAALNAKIERIVKELSLK